MVANGLSYFHKMIVKACTTSFQKSKSKEILYRNYKNFNINTFKNVLSLILQPIKSYESFAPVFLELLNEHVSLKKNFLGANHVPYVTNPLRVVLSLNVSILKIEPLKIKLNLKKNFCSKLYENER